MTCRAALLVVILLLSCNFAWADQKILFREDFRDLRNWEPLYFPKIERHTTYTTVSEGGRTYLKAQSQASASAIVFKKTFNPLHDSPYPLALESGQCLSEVERKRKKR
jgi:hypothetical protein